MMENESEIAFELDPTSHSDHFHLDINRERNDLLGKTMARLIADFQTRNSILVTSLHAVHFDMCVHFFVVCSRERGFSLILSHLCTA
jgi:hypothetical protein